MYCVIYRFDVRHGREDQFVRAWSEVTQAFIDHCEALGSRLHRAGDHQFVAYAQWPSRSVREEAELPPAVTEGAHAEMRECCERIETVFELTPVTDHLLLVHADTD